MVQVDRYIPLLATVIASDAAHVPILTKRHQVQDVGCNNQGQEPSLSSGSKAEGLEPRQALGRHEGSMRTRSQHKGRNQVSASSEWLFHDVESEEEDRADGERVREGVPLGSIGLVCVHWKVLGPLWFLLNGRRKLRAGVSRRERRDVCMTHRERGGQRGEREASQHPVPGFGTSETPVPFRPPSPPTLPISCSSQSFPHLEVHPWGACETTGHRPHARVSDPVGLG